MRSEEYDIIVIVETKLREQDSFKLQNFNVYRKDGKGKIKEKNNWGTGGVMIAIRKNMKHKIIQQEGNNENKQGLDILAIEIYEYENNGKEKGKINIIGIYNNPKNRINKDKWKNMIDNIRKKRKNSNDPRINKKAKVILIKV